jgi:hypothetical protein
VVFTVTFTLAFVVERFLRAGNMSRIHPGVLLENEPSGKSAAIALVPGLIVAFLNSEKEIRLTAPHIITGTNIVRRTFDSSPAL